MSAHFNFLPTPLAGLTVIQRKPIEDARGQFARLFCAEEFREIGLTKSIMQINYSITRCKGAVRGLHFQRPPHAEIKIISCLNGEVFDVAVDIRRNSPTFLHWHGEILSAANRKSFIIPEGFAHGFQVLSDGCELIYFHTADYAPNAEGGLNVGDPSIAIVWPLPINEISARDRSHLLINNSFQGIVV